MRDRKVKRGWLAASAAALVAGVAGIAVAVLPTERGESAAPTVSASAPPDFAGLPTALPRPAAGAPAWERQAWVAQEVTTMLRQQSERLIAGDYAGFSSVAAPGDAAAARDLKRRYDNLRALRVTRFDQDLEGPARLLDAKRGRWRVVAVARICFVDPVCAVDLTLFDTLWQETAQGLRFTGYAPHSRKEPCAYRCPQDIPIFVRPWEVTDLAVRVGKRTLVAAPVRYRDRLPALVARAEAAAALADRYMIGDAPVDRYRIFVADDAAWKRWYHGYPGRWVAGMALPTGPNGVEVTVLLSELTPAFTDRLLRHELAHVATLRSNTYYDNDDVWWLVEGMADHVEQQGAGTPYPRRAALRSFLDGRTLRSVRVTEPARNASDREAAGRYAVGYYALTHLVTRYGKTKTLEFFQHAVQYGLGLDEAARRAFGRSWSQIDKECTAAVRRA